MSSAFEWMVGLRYTRAKRRNHFISFISFISVIGIALGVAALIVVLSVMNGFQKEVRNRILSGVSHVDVSGPDNRLARWSEVLAELKARPDVRAAAPYVFSQGLISANGVAKGALVRGIEPGDEARVTEFSRHMVSGRWESLKPGEFGVILGSALAAEMQVIVGDKVSVIAPQGQLSPAGLLPRLKQFTVVGVFNMDMYEYDSGLAMIHLNDAQKLFRLGPDISGVRLKLDDLFSAPRFARQLTLKTPTPAQVTDWSKSHANYFEAVAMEKRMMFIILTIIVMVAAFNLVSTQVMLVTDKESDIAILRTMGATPGTIMRIFLIQGGLVGCVGTLAGLIGGVLIAWNVGPIVSGIESLVGHSLLPGSVYLITRMPSEIQWLDVGLITGITLLLSFFMTLYPSWRASRIQPAEALRYE